MPSHRFEKSPPIVVAHRGASGHLPEHTLEAYKLGIEMGADFIEPDLVITKDGVLVARHEPEIGMNTDVAQKFPKRKTSKMVDGKKVEGWFVEDFNFIELKSLRTKQHLEFRDQSHNGKYSIPSFEEVILLSIQMSQKLGRPIGIYPETKHPSYFKTQGLPLEKPMLDLLTKYKLNSKSAPVFIQSFEVSNLKELSKITQVRLVQLFDEETEKPYDFVLKGDKRTYGDLMTPYELSEIAKYAHGIGPWKRTIVKEDAQGKLLPPTTLIQDAHAAGLVVHPYTFRSESKYLNSKYAGSPEQEYFEFLALGVDGFFSDFPDHAFQARNKFLNLND